MNSKSVETGILLVSIVTQYLQFNQIKRLGFSSPLEIENKMSGNLVTIHIKKEVPLTLLHSERPKLSTILAFLSALGLIAHSVYPVQTVQNICT